VGTGQAVHIVDVDVREVWKRLKEEPTAVLIDVRTRAEWAYVGLPDLSSIGKRPFLIEWQTFPDNRVNPEFVERLSEMLEVAGIDKQAGLRKQWPKQAIRPVVMLRTVSRGHSMPNATAAGRLVGKPPVCPGRRDKRH